MNVDRSDLYKIWDALLASNEFLKRRDEMNAVLHLAKEIRYSPLTTETMSAVQRLETILREDNE